MRSKVRSTVARSIEKPTVVRSRVVEIRVLSWVWSRVAKSKRMRSSIVSSHG